jgi:hypothetical protein
MSFEGKAIVRYDSGDIANRGVAKRHSEIQPRPAAGAFVCTGRTAAQVSQMTHARRAADSLGRYPH